MSGFQGFDAAFIPPLPQLMLMRQQGIDVCTVYIGGAGAYRVTPPAEITALRQAGFQHLVLMWVPPISLTTNPDQEYAAAISARDKLGLYGPVCVDTEPEAGVAAAENFLHGWLAHPDATAYTFLAVTSPDPSRTIVADWGASPLPPSQGAVQWAGPPWVIGGQALQVDRDAYAASFPFASWEAPVVDPTPSPSPDPHPDKGPLPAKVVGVAAAPGGGYWVALAGGQVYNYGCTWHGSPHAEGRPVPGGIVGIAGVGNGYVLVDADGNVYNFGCEFSGSPAADGYSPPA